jgi:hypothetical protein
MTPLTLAELALELEDLRQRARVAVDAAAGDERRAVAALALLWVLARARRDLWILVERHRAQLLAGAA